MTGYYSRICINSVSVVLACRWLPDLGGLAILFNRRLPKASVFASRHPIIGEELLIFLMPQTSICHVYFQGFDYSKALYVSRRHLLYYIISVAVILVLIAFILHSPSRIKSSFLMFSYRLQAQSVSLSALGCRPWQPI